MRAQRVDEAQVEHLVGFVEHQDLDHRQVQEALLDQIDQPAGRRDQDVDAARQVLPVLVDAGAAKDGRDRQLGKFGIALRIVGDLAGQFASRGEDEHPAMGRQDALVRLDQTLDRREDESGGLAGAGLRDAEQIAAFQQRRDRVALDRGGFGIAFGFERADERLGEAEFGKGHGNTF
ncbi:Uncharacterised protein [Sphingomonas paucimobilis]|nr:Uncharacterised protein [Sphingomonas paucimobilis]